MGTRVHLYVAMDGPGVDRAMTLVCGIESPGGDSFNIVARMFRDPAVRAMHEERFSTFAHALVAMVRYAVAARLESPEYRRMCDDLRADPLFAAAWDAYDMATPLNSLSTLVQSTAVGTFAYQTLTSEIPDDDGHWLYIQVPDAPSAARLREAISKHAR